MKSVTINNLFYAFATLVGVLSVVPPSMVDVVPASWKPYLILGIMSAGWIKAHKNLFINPDGSSALTGWTKDNTPDV